MTRLRRVAVLGSGLMGSGIAEVVARAGMEVRVYDLDRAALEGGEARVRGSLERAVAGGKLSEVDQDATLHRLSFTDRLGDLGDRDLAIEAVLEDLEVKIELFRELDRILPSSAILATNTSSLAVTDLAASVGRPDRVVGLHFFNPAPIMKLVEVIRTLATPDEILQEALAWVRALGKEPVVSEDRAGFVVNLLLVPFILDAIRQLERGVASVDDLDRAMVLGCGHPLGPLQLSDLVGLDTLLRISEILFLEYREGRYAPPPLLRRMVTLGRWGRKTGKGFYDYSQNPPAPFSLS